MRLVVIVVDFREVFAGDAEVVGEVVVAGGDDELAGAEGLGAGETVFGVDGEVAVGALG